jgi:predicted acylesterase/phospholipase RssA
VESNSIKKHFMPKRLAIVISGAVSLGTYEAGVIYEILTALRQHNEAPETNPNDKIEIDVVTGASTGRMMAALTAQKLLFEADALRDPYHNAFYSPWVTDVSLPGLLSMGQTDDAKRSIFSSDLIETIFQAVFDATVSKSSRSTMLPPSSCREENRIRAFDV